MRRLGYTQRAILTSLAHGDRTVRTLAGDWLMTESAVRGSLNRMYHNGLVEPARFSGDSREWGITRRGQALLDESGAVEEPE